MPSAYEQAEKALFAANLDRFVAERKRLSTELGASGDREAAQRLAKIARPTPPAWLVNQLYLHDRKAFDELFRTAERLREFELDEDATAEHREVIARLRARAAVLLEEAGKPATEATLRRVTATLSALAAAGGFEPDRPGMLERDREAPGFEVAGLGALPAGGKKRARTEQTRTKPDSDERRGAAAERQRLARERAQRKAERERLERKLRIAKHALDDREQSVGRLEDELASAKKAAKEARSVVRDLEAELAKLD